MTTPVQGNLSEPAAKPDTGFESAGLSPDEADRLAASFKPSWEFDEAPFTQGSPLGAADVDALEGGGVNSEVRANLHHRDSERSYTVAPHVPPQRMETHEPEVSVIIDRSITAAEIEPRAQERAPAAVPSPFGAPMVAAAAAHSRVVAPVARSRASADESLELPSALKKSNKGLFIGLGAAALAAVLVFAGRAAMSGSSDDHATPTATTAVAPEPPRAAIPPVPTATAAAPAATPQVAAPTPPAAALAARTLPSPAAKPSPHAGPPPHHSAPRPPPPAKQSGGGIVRDVPF